MFFMWPTSDSSVWLLYSTLMARMLRQAVDQSRTSFDYSAGRVALLYLKILSAHIFRELGNQLQSKLCYNIPIS